MKKIWAIADLHLSFGIPNKEMDPFGEHWKHHYDKIEAHWRSCIQPEDLVLVAGDISWAMKLEEVAADLNWIASLPGTIIISKGNHDYWWNSLKKMNQITPPNIRYIYNNALLWNDVALGGTRLWDYPGISFNAFIEKKENKREKLPETPTSPEENQKIYDRELQRLELSLKQMDPQAKVKIAMIHYPPVNAAMDPSPVSDLLEKYGIDICVFGHLHNVKKDSLPFGEKRGVKYYLTACDYLDFKPLQIL